MLFSSLFSKQSADHNSKVALKDENSRLRGELAQVKLENDLLRIKIDRLVENSHDALRSADPILTPQVLGPRLEGLHFVMVGTCQVHHLVGAAAEFGYGADHFLYDSNEFSEVPSADYAVYDAGIIGLTFRSLIADAIGKARDTAHVRDFWTHEEAEAAMQRLTEKLDRHVRRIHDAMNKIPLFFFSFMEPSFQYDGLLIYANDLSFMGKFIRKANEIFEEIVSKYQNCYFYDVNFPLNAVGRLHLQDDSAINSMHNSIISNWDDDYDQERIVKPISLLSTFDVKCNLKMLHKIIFNDLVDNLKIIKQTSPVKLLIVDLDDTLWRGIAAEGAMEAWRREEGWPLGFIEALLYFKKRGGLLAICSKNDEEATRLRFQQICRDRITLDDFVSIKINWQPKSENIAQILQEVNLLPESAVFIDDNPREIDEVQAQFPTIRCLGTNHHDWRRIILRAPEMQVARISRESRQRTELLRAKIDRDAAATSLTRDEWLRSLDLRQEICAVRTQDHPNFARALELLNKTNQFNTNGKRWTHGELEDLLQQGGTILTAALRDKTVDNGIIGVTIVLGSEIVQAVLSCRVFGLGAEIVSGAIATRLALLAGPSAVASVVDTGKNATCHDYFKKLGFAAADAGRFTSETAPILPDWIAVTLDPALEGAVAL